MHQETAMTAEHTDRKKVTIKSDGVNFNIHASHFISSNIQQLISKIKWYARVLEKGQEMPVK